VMSPRPISRRSMIAGTAAAAGGALLSKLPPAAEAHQATAASAAAPPPVVGDPTKAPGAPTTAVGERSPFVQPTRAGRRDHDGLHAGSRISRERSRRPISTSARIHSRHPDDRPRGAHAAHSRSGRPPDVLRRRRHQAFPVGHARTSSSARSLAAPRIARPCPP
jgi:hypothetical protein